MFVLPHWICVYLVASISTCKYEPKPNTNNQTKLFDLTPSEKSISIKNYSINASKATMIIEDATQKSAIKLNSDNMGLIWNDTLSEFHQFWEMTINYTNHALVQTAAMIQQHRSLQLTIFFIIFIILFISIYSIFFCIYLCKRHCLIKSKYTKKSIKKQLAQSKRNIKRQKHRLFSDDDGCGPQSERRYLLLPTDEQIDIEENQLFGNNV